MMRKSNIEQQHQNSFSCLSAIKSHPLSTKPSTSPTRFVWFPFITESANGSCERWCTESLFLVCGRIRSAGIVTFVEFDIEPSINNVIKVNTMAMLCVETNVFWRNGWSEWRTRTFITIPWEPLHVLQNQCISNALSTAWKRCDVLSYIPRRNSTVVITSGPVFEICQQAQ